MLPCQKHTRQSEIENSGQDLITLANTLLFHIARSVPDAPSTAAESPTLSPQQLKIRKTQRASHTSPAPNSPSRESVPQQQQQQQQQSQQLEAPQQQTLSSSIQSSGASANTSSIDPLSQVSLRSKSQRAGHFQGSPSNAPQLTPLAYLSSDQYGSHSKSKTSSVHYRTRQLCSRCIFIGS